MRALARRLATAASVARRFAHRWTAASRGKRFLLVAVAGCTSCVVVSNCWVACSARGRIYDDVDEVPKQTVAIVPGAAVWRNRTPSNALRYRLEGAVALYEAGKVEKILVSGDHGRTSYDEVNTMRRWLIKRGVPSSRIYMDHAGFRTLDTMARARAVFRVEDAVICTQPFHLARAIFLARSHDLYAIGLEVRAHRADRLKDGVREMLARSRAVADVLFGVEPRFYGEPVPISGSASATH